LIISSNNSNATTFEQADSLFGLCLYPEACIAYEQIIYENPVNEYIKANSLLKKSNCYKAECHYSLIDNLLSRCNVNELNDTLKSQILFEQSLACYMSEKFTSAKERILPVFNINTTPELEKASVFLYSLILNELSSWEESKNNLISFLKRTEISDEKLRDSLIQEVNIMYQKKNIPKLKKIKTARTLSFILPGLGQTYAGKTGKGLISLSLVALSGTFVYFNIIHHIYTSSAVGLYLFSYFYIGNVNQLKTMVNKRNNNKKNKINAYLRSQLTKLNSQLN
jgi:TM2 domain-containing membrane protein YozV